MKKSSYFDQIYAYLNGELLAEDRKDFEEAVQNDPNLAAELDFQRRLKTAAEHRAAQAEAKDIMAQLRSKGIFEDVARQAERDRQLLESAQGDPDTIARLLAEHSSLADWKALDPEGFEEVVEALTPARVLPMWVWVRWVAAVAVVLVSVAGIWWFYQQPTITEQIANLPSNTPEEVQSSGFGSEISDCVLLLKEANSALLKNNFERACKFSAAIARQNGASVFTMENAELIDEDCPPHLVQFARTLYTKAYAQLKPEDKSKLEEMLKLIRENDNQ